MLRYILLTMVFAFGTQALAADMMSFQVVDRDHIQGDKLYFIHSLVDDRLRKKGEDPDDFEMVSMTVQAKSRHGQGKATFRLGADVDTKAVPMFGSGSDFMINAPWAFHTLHWDLKGMEGAADERWQLQINGNVKIDRVDVRVTRVARRVRINLNDHVFHGTDLTIRLRNQLKNMGINTQGRKLRNVTLVAKSAAGQGYARLRIGEQFRGKRIIDRSQNGWPFDSDRPVSYDRVQWNVGGATQGVWQLLLTGKIKVKAVIVEFQ